MIFSQNTFLCLIPLFLIFTGCSSVIHDREGYLDAYKYGNLNHAADTLTKTLQKEMPEGDYRSSKNAVWLLLDRATIQFARGNASEAVADYRLAIEALDYYNQDSSLELLGKVALQDSFGAYCCEDFEQVLARVYFALALLHEGDTMNAYALLRQAEELQQKKREIYQHAPFKMEYDLADNALEKYLFAAILERQGDRSNAKILYHQAAVLAEENFCCLDSSEDAENFATLIILSHNGNAPEKISVVTGASIASTVAIEFFLNIQKIPPAISCLGGVPLPTLSYSNYSESTLADVSIDSQSVPFIPIYSINDAATRELNQKLPVIAARAVARYTLRRSAVACAQKQNRNLGDLADVGMLVANLNTKADTRSWGTLPATISLARRDISSGEHIISFCMKSPVQGMPPVYRQYSLCLKPNDFCVINVFNIHSGITTIQIPERFRK